MANATRAGSGDRTIGTDGPVTSTWSRAQTIGQK